MVMFTPCKHDKHDNKYDRDGNQCAYPGQGGVSFAPVGLYEVSRDGKHGEADRVAAEKSGYGFQRAQPEYAGGNHRAKVHARNIFCQV